MRAASDSIPGVRATSPRSARTGALIQAPPWRPGRSETLIGREAALGGLAQLVLEEEELHGGVAHTLSEGRTDPSVTLAVARDQQHWPAG